MAMRQASFRTDLKLVRCSSGQTVEDSCELKAHNDRSQPSLASARPVPVPAVACPTGLEERLRP